MLQIICAFYSNPEPQQVYWENTDTREVYGRDYESDRNGGWGTTMNKVKKQLAAVVMLSGVSQENRGGDGTWGGGFSRRTLTHWSMP